MGHIQSGDGRRLRPIHSINGVPKCDPVWLNHSPPPSIPALISQPQNLGQLHGYLWTVLLAIV